MRFLGIDYGTKRVGLALSDENARLAFPKKIIPNTSDLFARIREVVQQEGVDEIVVGESLDFKNEKNAVEAKIGKFVELLEKLGLPINREKEFFTTVEARRHGGSALDASAAALILQRYLDRRNNQQKK